MRTNHTSCIIALVAALAAGACSGGGGASATTGTGSTTGGGSAATVASVTVASSGSNMAAGASMTFLATAKDAAGSAVGASFSWSSSDETIALIRSTGIAYGISAGTATITAAAGGVTGTKVLTITAPSGSVTSAYVMTVGNTFFPTNVTVAQGGTVTFLFGGTTHNVDFGSSIGRPSNIGDTQNSDNPSTFSTRGTFSYSCTLHPGMVGTVTVI